MTFFVPTYTGPQLPNMEYLRNQLAAAESHTRTTRFKFSSAVLQKRSCDDHRRAALAEIQKMRSDAEQSLGGTTDPIYRESLWTAQGQLEQAQQSYEEAVAHVERFRDALAKAEQREANARKNWNHFMAGHSDRSERFKEEKSHLKRPVPKAKRTEAAKALKPPTKESIDGYLAALSLAFADYTTIRRFPEPHPKAPCTLLACGRTAKSRALLACPCLIKAIYGGLDKAELKTARLQYHPDKFARCDEGLRAGFQKKAQEMFIVLDGMYQRKV